MSTRDRIKYLKFDQDPKSITGIDFIHIPKELENDLATIHVHFLVDPDKLDSRLQDNLTLDQILIYRDSGDDEIIKNPPVGDPFWESSGKSPTGKAFLKIKTRPPEKLVPFRLKIKSKLIDPFFNDIKFRYNAGCVSDLDCKDNEHECPEEDIEDVSIDYSARDFWSFRRALLDFASLRYPEYKERLEADAGIMLTEVMSALGDELAYYQDRVAREAYLETATQRRSLGRIARLVDYTVHDGLGASGWIDVTVKEGDSAELESGIKVWSASEEKGEVFFEIGRGLRDIISRRKADDSPIRQTYRVDPAINSLSPHIWDEDDKCLPVGTTELYIEGQHKENLAFDYPPKNDKIVPPIEPDGKWVILQTNPKVSDVPIRRWMVKLIEVKQSDEIWDPLIDPVNGSSSITLIKWEQSHALPFEMDLETLEIHCNIIPVTAGKLHEDYFTTGKDLAEINKLKQTVERVGPNGSVIHLFSLDDTDTSGLVYLGTDERSAVPEILLEEVRWEGGHWKVIHTWDWRRSFLGIHSSTFTDNHFILEDGMWRRVVGYQRSGTEVIHRDYATGSGKTIRFGDGEFGRVPPRGTVFRVSYRTGRGTFNNVPDDAITEFNHSGRIDRVNNPLPITNGSAPEDIEPIRLFAPEEYKATTYRAVLDEDYAEAAERLEWVQRSGAKSRWTGSWLSVFSTPDPLGTTILTRNNEDALYEQLNLFRQTGREVIVKQPLYANIDLRIGICVSPEHFSGEVKEFVIEALLGKKGIIRKPGFFSPDNFTFGESLKRPVLEAAIQSVEGVKAVMCMEIKRRGWHDWRLYDEYEYTIDKQEVIRLENNPEFPERGILELNMEGGA